MADIYIYHTFAIEVFSSSGSHLYLPQAFAIELFANNVRQLYLL